MTRIQSDVALSVRVSYQFNGERFANMIDMSMMQE